MCLVHMLSGCVLEFCMLFMTILNICGQIVGKDISVLLYVDPTVYCLKLCHALLIYYVRKVEKP